MPRYIGPGTQVERMTESMVQIGHHGPELSSPRSHGGCGHRLQGARVHANRAGDEEAVPHNGSARTRLDRFGRTRCSRMGGPPEQPVEGRFAPATLKRRTALFSAWWWSACCPRRAPGWSTCPPWNVQDMTPASMWRSAHCGVQATSRRTLMRSSYREANPPRCGRRDPTSSGRWRHGA